MNSLLDVCASGGSKALGRRFAGATPPCAHMGISALKPFFVSGDGSLRKCKRPSKGKILDSYKLIFDADLAKLPTDVLKSIGASIRKELDVRRNAKLVSNRMELSCDASAAKLFMADPKYRHEYSKHKHRYLEELLNQDWSHLFYGGDDEPKYYVYMHYEPSGKQVKFVSEHLKVNIKGWPFYVGKGCGNRAYDLKRNQGHGKLLEQILSSGRAPSDIVSIVKHGLTEAKAFELESKLIYFFGTRYEKDRKGCLVNLDIPDRPLMSKFVP